VVMIFLTVLLTIGYRVRFFIGVCLSSIGSHPFVSVGGWDGFIVFSMFGLFGLSVFGGSIFVNFVDGLIGRPVSLSYQDKVLLLESSVLGSLLYLAFFGHVVFPWSSNLFCFFSVFFYVVLGISEKAAARSGVFCCCVGSQICV